MDKLGRYEAAMVLSAVGDAIGYKKGDWEVCRSGYQIHEELQQLGEVNSISVNKEDWPVSDDTVMHIATAKALVQETPGEEKEKLFARLAKEYKECMHLMAGRSPGATCVNSANILKPDEPGGYIIPFNKHGGGCGAAMRAMCIGLRYSSPEDLPDLICVSIESGRMTHHHPTGYLGALTTALFTSYAIQGVPLISWGQELVNLLPAAWEYVEKTNIEVELNRSRWGYFESQWNRYLSDRGISDGKSKPKFPKPYNVNERDDFYKSYSFYKKIGGSSGHDAPIIAYDALLGCHGNWKELCLRGMFHGGDNDSTGVIAGCLYGAMFGFKGVKKCNYKNIEFKTELLALAKELYTLKHPDQAILDDRTTRKCVIL